ncbi:MAG: hypothetical protein U0414_26600 [Polyangiaceae bacterium]
MSRTVRTSTLAACAVALSCALGIAPAARAEPPADTPNHGAHPALVVGAADLAVTGVLVPIGIGMGAGVRDNGWEKASAVIGAGLGLGAIGAAAAIHGEGEGARTLKDPVAAGFGWMFTSLAASGVGAGLGLVIGGDEAAKPVGGILAASSLAFLAPGIPLIADGERTAVEPPRWGPPAEADRARTEMNSPAMVGIGSTCIVLGGLGSFIGLAGVVAGSGISGSGGEQLSGIGGGLLGGGLALALAVGTPLVVVGAKRVPAAPSVGVGPSRITMRGEF